MKEIIGEIRLELLTWETIENVNKSNAIEGLNNLLKKWIFCANFILLKWCFEIRICHTFLDQT